MSKNRDYKRSVEALRACEERRLDPCDKCPFDYGDDRCRSLGLDAADAIEELVGKVPTWISVEERLPETASRVLTYNGEYVIENWLCTTIDIEGKHLVWAYNERLITHWMPLPAQPMGMEKIHD